MGVVSHSYGGLGRDEGGGCQVCWTKPGGVDCMSGNAGVLSMCEVKTHMSPDHTAFQDRTSSVTVCGIVFDLCLSLLCAVSCLICACHCYVQYHV